MKLLDFGLAKMRPAAVSGMSVAATVGAPLTDRGTILGTLQYMSPEQVEGHEADHRSDVFALGAIVYEMATGKRAFEGNSPASVMAAILERRTGADGVASTARCRRPSSTSWPDASRRIPTSVGRARAM